MTALRHPSLPWIAPALAALVAGTTMWHADDARLGAGAVLVVLALLTAWIVWQDLVRFTICDAASLAIATVAVGCRLADARATGAPVLAASLALAADGLLPGAVLLAFREIYYRRKGVDGLGLGDVKLAAAGGMLLGATAFAWALLAGSLAALAFVGVRQLAGRPLAASDKLAFGAVLAPAIFVTFVAEQVPLLLAAS